MPTFWYNLFCILFSKIKLGTCKKMEADGLSKRKLRVSLYFNRKTKLLCLK
nr:MAG TPA: hypothetical protein [Caudoviricetes sp.]